MNVLSDGLSTHQPVKARDDSKEGCTVFLRDSKLASSKNIVAIPIRALLQVV